MIATESTEDTERLNSVCSVAKKGGSLTTPNRSRAAGYNNRDEKSLNEDEKETKRKKIEDEIGKTYNYDLSGQRGESCKTWANKIYNE